MFACHKSKKEWIMLRHYNYKTKRHLLLTHCERHVAFPKESAKDHNTNANNIQYNFQQNKLMLDLNQINQKFNQRIIFNLELYHKNILKKSKFSKTTFSSSVNNSHRHMIPLTYITSSNVMTI